MTIVIIILLSIICLALDIMLIGWKIESKIEESKVKQNAKNSAISEAIKQNKVGEVAIKVKYAVKNTTIKVVKGLRLTIGALRNAMLVSIGLFIVAFGLVAIIILSVFSFQTILLPEEDEQTAQELGISNSDSTSSHSTKADNLIIVGDSRTCGMYNSIYGGSEGEYNIKNENNDVFICKNDANIDWLSSKTSTIESYFTEEANMVVIVNVGIKDVLDADNTAPKYVDWLKTQSESWKEKGIKLVFMSVNPCDTSKYATDSTFKPSNEDVKNFNKMVKEGIGGSDAEYLDAYSFIEDFKSTDGILYEEDTYRAIYEYIKDSYKKNTNVQENTEETTEENSSEEN